MAKAYNRNKRKDKENQAANAQAAVKGQTAQNQAAQSQTAQGQTPQGQAANQKQATAQDKSPAKAGPVVNVVPGAGNALITVPYKQNDTVDAILRRANIALNSDNTVTLGRRRIKHPAKTPVNPGDTLVIAGKIRNG